MEEMAALSSLHSNSTNSKDMNMQQHALWPLLLGLQSSSHVSTFFLNLAQIKDPFDLYELTLIASPAFTNRPLPKPIIITSHAPVTTVAITIVELCAEVGVCDTPTMSVHVDEVHHGHTPFRSSPLARTALTAFSWKRLELHGNLTELLLPLFGQFLCM
jgi:hypothetical protein